jgi:hypothetical protein
VSRQPLVITHLLTIHRALRKRALKKQKETGQVTPKTLDIWSAVLSLAICGGSWLMMDSIYAAALALEQFEWQKTTGTVRLLPLLYIYAPG